MQRNGTQHDRDRRGSAERGDTQPMAGEPRDESDDDELQPAESVPSFLTARELQARDPRTSPKDDSDREQASASSRGARHVSGDDDDDEDEPPRGERGETGNRTGRAPKRKGT